MAGRAVLADSRAVITGGSRGIGFEIAMTLAHAGADVVIASRSLEACERVARDIREETHRVAVPVKCHVGNWDDLADLHRRSYEEFGQVDILVNNAGIAPTYESLSEVSAELFDKTIAVNLRAPFRLSALFGASMQQCGSGSIINVSSIAAVRPRPHDLPYAAAKAALHVLTEGFAQDLGPQVRVNTLVLGPFLTDIASGWDMEAFNVRLQRYPARRAGDPSEAARAALFLASEASSYITGSTLTVDGGSSLTR
jgi:NAD(P)-dependent dehydrogenase (short-subunit alcohol dehydrogenase family)